ncbi:MAG: dUTP diphosphatase [Faecalibacillus faecis]|uniref:dUTP diphosphatase n=1 Tax=Faecalibacillus faecis TaxID=1982628 RepID=UPI00399618D3
MKIKEQLKEMFQMQRTLNKSILDEFGEEEMTEEKLELAIIDELGELTHELKGDWCWWKKSQAPVNRKRVLEELVDVYHFVMTSEIARRYSSTDEIIDSILNKYEFSINHFDELEKERLDYLIGDISYSYDKLTVLLQLTKCLQFSFDDVYQEYLNKNKINYERLKNGY